MSFKLALNAGHGLYTKGKHCLDTIDPNETREWVLNARICNKIEEKLKAYDGIEVLRLDDVTGNVDVALKTRTNKANTFNADFYLAIHANAGIKGGKGGGIVAYVYSYPDDKSVEWQEALYKAVVEKTGLKGNRSKPLSRADFHELRESAMPSVLMECGFMDSTVDTPIILTENFTNKVAEGCVEVIVKKAKLKKKATTKPVVNTGKTETKTTYYKQYTGTSRSLVDGLNAIGVDSSFDNRAKIAKINDVVDYRGLASQNSSLLALLKKGQLIKSKTTVTVAAPVNKVTYFKQYTGASKSIVSALKAIGEESSFNYRGVIAAANGIDGYKGTATQNTSMLKMLKAGKLIKP